MSHIFFEKVICDGSKNVIAPMFATSIPLWEEAISMTLAWLCGCRRVMAGKLSLQSRFPSGSGVVEIKQVPAPRCRCT